MKISHYLEYIKYFHKYYKMLGLLDDNHTDFFTLLAKGLHKDPDIPSEFYDNVLSRYINEVTNDYNIFNQDRKRFMKIYAINRHILSKLGIEINHYPSGYYLTTEDKRILNETLYKLSQIKDN